MHQLTNQSKSWPNCTSFASNCFPILPYSPDLAPSDYYRSRTIQKDLEKLENCWAKCIKLKVDYVEE
ncbi:unnamed protein product [Pieris macdunnoughi]|uniref:Uncharacterized protein n=1 Tax=Pieris macdunnoughi TaxID=345717 RepID=A0A821TFB2_9NEOP|nr:unnamed protein product [Pieris macdunnoughi]